MPMRLPSDPRDSVSYLHGYNDAKLDYEVRHGSMTVFDGYSLTQYVAKNLIVITIPPTWDTLTSTVAPIADRKKALTDAEEVALLTAVKAMLENGND